MYLHCSKSYLKSCIFLNKIFKKIILLYLFIFGCIGSSVLRRISLGEPGLLFIAVRGLLIAVASLVAEPGL